MGLSDAEIAALITCPKVTDKPPRRQPKLERGSLRNDADLISQDQQHHFHMFIRQNAELIEDFSVGLIYRPLDGSDSIDLFRCNGQHGGHRSFPLDKSWHSSYHIHRATASAMDAGLRANLDASLCDAYASFEEALEHFLTTINLVDRDQHFPRLKRQLDLWPPTT